MNAFRKLLTLLFLILTALPIPAQNAPSPWLIHIDDGSTISSELRDSFLARDMHPISVSIPEILSGSRPELKNPRAIWTGLNLSRVPAALLREVHGHLARGGGFLALGDVPFRELLYPWQGKFVSEQTLLRAAFQPNPIFNIDQSLIKSLRINSDKLELPNRMELANETISGGTTSTLHANIPDLHGWTTFHFPVSADPSTRNAVTSFWAKGTPDTNRLAIEWEEKDNSRWIAAIDLTPDWQYYVLKADQFRFWYDGVNKTRGGNRDELNPANGKVLGFGLAMTHTKVRPGKHEFWLAGVGLAAPNPAVKETFELPEIHGMFPVNSLYSMEPKRLDPSPAFAWINSADFLPVPANAWSNYWRPMGSGIEKQRRWRYIPVVSAYNANDSRAGCVAHLTQYFDDPLTASIYGAVGIPDHDILLGESWMNVVATMLNRMHDRTFFEEAGTDEFAYDIRDLSTTGVTAGWRVASNIDTSATTRVQLSIADAESSELLKREEPATAKTVRFPLERTAEDGRKSLKLRADLIDSQDRLLDRIEQEIHFDGARPAVNFMQTKKRGFTIDEKPWRAFGVNYMPSSGLALGHPQEFEFFLEDRSYDPNIVDADLKRIRDLGMNMISVFLYNNSIESGNLPDLLHHCRKYGLMVNLSMRPNMAPWASTGDVTRPIIETFRLAEKTEIMAYDIAWEPWWGSAGKRAEHANAWMDWVDKTYGSTLEAYKKWKFEPGDLEQFPSDDDFRKEGKQSQAVAAYRKFVHDSIRAQYAQAKEEIKAVDPNHLVSFRQSEGANPLVDPAQFPVELEAVHDVVDFFSPEAYGIGDADKKARLMQFAASYAYGLAPEKPVLWAEYGSSVWSGSGFRQQPLLMQMQYDCFRRIFENAQASRSAGIVAWWYPGGYRRGEESDYGLFNADGTDRLITPLIKEWADRLKATPPTVQWKPEIKSDAANGARGYPAIYKEIGDEYFNEVTSNTLPIIRRTDLR